MFASISSSLFIEQYSSNICQLLIMYETLYQVLYNDEQNRHDAWRDYIQIEREKQDSHKTVTVAMIYHGN